MIEVFHAMVEVVSEGVDVTFVITGPPREYERVVKVASLEVAVLV